MENLSSAADNGGQPMLTIGQVRDKFREAQNLSDTERSTQSMDDRYYFGYQYTQEELRIYHNRKQPAIVTNLIRPAINNVVGFEIRQRADPKCLPRTPNHEQQAEAATEVLRYIADNTKFQRHTSHVAGQIFRRGMGAVEVCVNPDKPDEVQVVGIRATDFFRDPRSRAADFEDARYLGYAVWMDQDEITARYPEHADEIKASYDQPAGAVTNDFEDRPMDGNAWGDTRRQRVLVVTMYYARADTWYYCRYVGGGILEQMVSPYLDEDSKPECAIYAVSGYVDEDGNRQGLIRDMLGPQDETNHRRSKLLHMMNTRQVITEEGVVEDVEKARVELVRPDGWTEVRPGSIDKLRIERNLDQTQGQSELLRDSKEDIMRVSPHSSMAETNSPNASGRALMARQQTSSMELAGFFDNLRDWRYRVYKAFLNRAKQFWDTEKYIRVSDDADEMSWITINQPKMQDTPFGQMPMMQMGPDGQLQPQLDNAIADMDMDIIIEEGADYATLAQEQYDGLLNLASAGVTFPPEFYVKASSMRNKKELLEAIKQPEPDPMQGQMAQAQLEKLQSEIAKNMAAAEKADAEADQTEMENEAGASIPISPNVIDLADAQTRQAQAETQRYAAMHPQQLGGQT